MSFNTTEASNYILAANSNEEMLQRFFEIMDNMQDSENMVNVHKIVCVQIKNALHYCIQNHGGWYRSTR